MSWDIGLLYGLVDTNTSTVTVLPYTITIRCSTITMTAAINQSAINH